MKNTVVLQNLDHFSLMQILESGQVFRFDRISPNSAILIAQDTLVKLTQQPESSTLLIHNSSMSDVEQRWHEYFDLSTNYKAITDELSKKDEHMRNAISFGEGIRILRQDPWEMLISFIISQNKAIPHIKQCIQNISEAFGKPLEEVDGHEKKYFTFPKPHELIRATEEELRACKVGFRAPYIMDACQKVVSEEINLNDLYLYPTENAKKELLKIKGVGPKIADCILLFAYGKSEVFPTDVWIKRVMEGFYFNGEDMKAEYIGQFAKEYFGDLAGYAQQYLFFYARENHLFK